MTEYRYEPDLTFDIQWFVLNQRWDDEVFKLIMKNKIDTLYLNYVKGWSGENLNFLRKLSHLRYFKVLDPSLEDISGINELSNLEFLDIDTYCKTIINFDNFKKLRVCVFSDWRAGCDSLFDCNTLHYLTISKYSKPSFDKFSKLTNLETLNLHYPKFDNLEGIGSLKKLRSVRIVSRKLSSIDHLSEAYNLETLFIQGCRKIENIDALGSLKKLKILLLEDIGRIDSIRSIVKCTNLEHLALSGSTNILDGDLSFLMKMPKLKLVLTGDRKHYSHKNRDFPQITEEGPPLRIKI